ncbi:MAG: YkvA family protein [Methylococcus sp.]
MTNHVKAFWAKIRNSARKAGREVIYRALQLFYAAQRKETPSWARGVIYAALAYFITPTDAVPDALPGGFLDDLGVLAGALTTVALYITPEVNRQAREKLEFWLDAEDEVKSPPDSPADDVEHS